jgi:hypothetical protein
VTCLDVNIDPEFGNLLSELATLGMYFGNPGPFFGNPGVKFGNRGPNSGNLCGEVANRQKFATERKEIAGRALYQPQNRTLKK